MKPNLYAGITGNGRMLAAYGCNGELYRLFWPHIDIFQHINVTWAALLSPSFGDRAIRLDDSETWMHSQEYVHDTAILKTVCQDKHNRFSVTIFDFVAPHRDILMRCFEVSNNTGSRMPAGLLYYTSLYMNESNILNSNFYDQPSDTLFHYRMDSWLGVAGDNGPSSYQCGCDSDEALYGNMSGNRVALAPNGCQFWDLGVLEPGETKRVALCFAAGRTQEEALENISYFRETGWDGLIQETSAFWADYLKRAYVPEEASSDIKKMFRRSVMVGKLLANRETGAIIAAPEVDEACNCCGGYGFCWVRDAVIIAHAMLKAGYADYARDFYRWAARHQDPSGAWPQRHYTTGALAPRWGDQIDETGAALWGMCQYYKETWDDDFLEEIWPCVEKAVGFLISNLGGENGLPQLSWDLWEERFGEHAYSYAAVYAGLKGAGQIAKKLGYGEVGLKWLEASISLKNRIVNYFWDPELERFIRSGWLGVSWHEFDEKKRAGCQVRGISGPAGYVTYQAFGDETPDISLLGLTVPFGLIEPDDVKMRKTAEHLKETLINKEVGGILRYSTDTYQGGNPWVLTTLWLGMFEGAAGDWESASARLDWALKCQNSLGLLPEQVDKHTGKPVWVVPLAWSHAMFILLVNMMSEVKRF